MDKINQKSVKPKKSYTYKPAYGIVVICRDEAHQITLFNQLRQQGLELKVVSV